MTPGHALRLLSRHLRGGVVSLTDLEEAHRVADQQPEEHVHYMPAPAIAVYVCDAGCVVHGRPPHGQELTQDVVRVTCPGCLDWIADHLYAEELLAIRAGAWTYDHLIAWAHDREAELKEVVKSSPLPREPDRKRLDALLVMIVAENI